MRVKKKDISDENVHRFHAQDVEERDIYDFNAGTKRRGDITLECETDRDHRVLQRARERIPRIMKLAEEKSTQTRTLHHATR